MSTTWGSRPQRQPLTSGVMLMGGLGLAIVGLLAVSYSLMPDRLETSAMALERGDASTAEDTLNQAMTRGSVPPGQIQPLVDMALELSEPDRATTLLRGYLATHAGDTAALRQLADVLEQQHRTVEAAEVLEQLYSVTHDIEVLRLVAGIYASLNMRPQRVQALNRLFDRKAEDSDQLLELAQSLAADGQPKEALADLLTRLESNPTDPTAAGLAGLGAALTIGQPDAAALAARLGRAATTAERVRSIVQTYVQRGALPLALAAVRAAQPGLQRDPGIVLTMAELEVQNGEEEAALARLQAGPLTADGVPLLIDLELRRGDVAAAIVQAQTLRPEAMPVGFAARLVEVARERGKLEALRPLDPAHFQQEPAAAAVIALARGERSSAADYARAALLDVAALPDDLQAFQDALGNLSLEDVAMTRLLDATRSHTISQAGLRLLSRLVGVSPARNAAALPVLTAARDSLPGAGPVWAVIAASGGLEAPVLAWLQSQRGRLETGLLLDLLTTAVQRHQPKLATTAATELEARTDLPVGWTAPEVALLGAAARAMPPAVAVQALAFIAQPGTGADARTRVAELLAGASNAKELERTLRGARMPVPILIADVNAMAGGLDGVAARLQLLMAIDPAAATPLLLQHEPADPARLGPLLVAAQLTAGRAAEAITTLRHLLVGIAPAQREALLFNIREVVGAGGELPVVALGADLLGGTWEQAYQDALEHSGQHGVLVARLRAQAAHASAAQRTAIASRLLELGDKPAAIALVKELAMAAGPQTPIVQQLLYLYGPTADPDAVAWVRGRAAAAPAAEFQGWVGALDYLGSPSSVAAVIEARPDLLARNPKLADTYADALVRSGGHNRGAAIARAAASTRDVAVLKSLGRAAEDADQPALAHQLSAQVLAAAPNDAEALLQAARHASSARRSSDAVRLYARAAEQAPLGVDDLLDDGDALLTQNRRPEATTQYRAALIKLPADPAKPAQGRQRARALHGLGMDREASSLLNRLLQTYPNDAGIQSDLLQISVDAR